MPAPEHIHDHQPGIVIEAADVVKGQGPIVGVAYIMRASGVIADSAERRHFDGVTILDTAEKLAFGGDLSPDKLLTMLKCVQKPEERVLDFMRLGDNLSRDDTQRQNSQVVLSYTSDIYEASYNRDPEAENQDPPLPIEEYVRVAELQNSAGDKEGARATAKALTPHLIAAIGRLGEDQADHLMLATLYKIDSLQATEAKQLLRNIQNENFKQAYVVLQLEKSAKDLLEAGMPDESLELIEGINFTPGGLWGTALALQEADEPKVVEKFITGLQKKFPEHFEAEDDYLTGFSPITKVLARAGRDDILAKMFSTIIVDGHSKRSIIDFAFTCGAAGQKDRLDAMAETIQPLPELVEQMSLAYQQGRQKVALSAEQPES